MYTYRFYNVYSTKPSTIVDENDNAVGSVMRVYGNGVKKAVDFLLKGRTFVNYIVKNAQDEVVFSSEKDRNLFKKRQYHISYTRNNEEFQMHLVDKKAFDAGEKTSFEFNGETFELIKPPFKKAQIKKEGTLIAEWNSTLSVPFTAHFELKNERYRDDELFFLGLFHTYLHAG